MEVTVERTVEVSLNADEAEWLLRAMQNPIGGEHPRDEEPEDREMRSDFFESLCAALQ